MTDTSEKTLKRGLLPLDLEAHAAIPGAEAVGFSFPAPTYPIDKTAGIKDLGMGGNGPDSTLTVNGGQPCGDCGPNVAPKNADFITAVALGETYTELTSNQIVTLYFTYQAELAGIAWRPEGDSWTAPDGLDVGVEPTAWVTWLFQNGYVRAFLKLDPSEVDAALYAGCAVIAAVNLNPQADQQVEAGEIWDIGPDDEPDPEDGHFIILGGVEHAGGNSNWGTWGQWQLSTGRWREGCAQLYYALLTPQQAQDAGMATDQYDSLVALLHEMGGTTVVSPPSTNIPPLVPPTPPVAPGVPVIPAPRPPLPLSHQPWWEDVVVELKKLEADGLVDLRRLL